MRRATVRISKLWHKEEARDTQHDSALTKLARRQTEVDGTLAP